MPLHFLPRGVPPICSNICSIRAACSFVCSKCCWNPAFSSGDDAFLIILGRALMIWFSAEYKSFNSSTNSSFSDSIFMFILQSDLSGCECLVVRGDKTRSARG